MNTPVPVSPTEALEALQAERDLYARVLDLSRRQCALAESGPAEELLPILAEKQKLAEQAAETAERTRSLKASWKTATEAWPADQRERGRGLVGEIRKLLEQVLAEDEASQKALSGRRGGALEALLKMQQGRRAHQAYGRRPEQPPPRFKDETK